MYLEARKYNLSGQTKAAPVLFTMNQNIPIDVNEINAETEKVALPTNNDPIKVLNLEKTYPNGFQAVNNISLSVEKGQIFGLLGPNGAGKSTSFSILTALIPRTKGSVKLQGQEIDTDLAHIFKEVGITPQFDCLWDNLSVKEHLYLFGSLKGLHGPELQENLDYFIKVMSLEDHVNKRSSTLSGGNKRKLCVTNALIGSPSLQFFDEPSTGLDPVARRFLWNTLTQNLAIRNSSIIFTTHSMSEAESLCHKIGILVNGRFVCFGSTSYLKNKYGEGYKITVKKSDTFQGNLDGFMPQIHSQITKVVSASQNYETFQVPTVGFSFSKAFNTLETMKRDGVISDFSIYNTTLEQVFIAFSKYQYVKEE
jgi:ABC-type multidrug transport system ATPase subunit